MQLYHAGRMANPKFNEGEQPISASPIAALRPDAVPPREMTHAQINQMIDDFGEARRAIEAGFDGVEIHGANTYLLQQFSLHILIGDKIHGEAVVKNVHDFQSKF